MKNTKLNPKKAEIVVLLKLNLLDLKKQKSDLVIAQESLKAIGGKDNKRIVDSLEGLFNLIEAIQDKAVDVDGYEEKDVFDLTGE